MKYKNYTRSPQYGKIYSYDEKGRKVHEYDVLQLEVEHEGVDYTVGKLLQMVVEHSAEEKKILADLQAKSVELDVLGRTIAQLTSKNQLLVDAVKKLTAEVVRIKSNNRGI